MRPRDVALAFAAVFAPGCSTIPAPTAEGLGEWFAAFRFADGSELLRLEPAELEAVGGAAMSPQIELPDFDRAVVSWNGVVPPGVERRVEVRALSGDAWSGWFAMARVGAGGVASVPAPPTANGRVAVDLLELREPARAIQVRVVPEADGLASLGVTTWRHGTPRDPGSGIWLPARRVLDVPARSQRVEAPELAPRACSPTSLAMVLEWFGTSLPTAEVAARVRDAASGLYGNWTANAVFAGSVVGEAFVVRCGGLGPIEGEVHFGRPVVARLVFGPGELGGSPLERTDGHLVVVVGFDASGDVVVNDPAAPPGSVCRTYAREEFSRAWLEGGDGIAYVFRRPGATWLPRGTLAALRERAAGGSATEERG